MIKKIGIFLTLLFLLGTVLLVLIVKNPLFFLNLVHPEKPLESRGTVINTNFECSVPYLRCTLLVKEFATDSIVALVFNAYDNYLTPTNPKCTEWADFDNTVQPGDQVAFKAYGPHQYSDGDANIYYEVCRKYSVGLTYPSAYIEIQKKL